MNSLAVLCLLVIILSLAEAARINRDVKYTTKFDNIDVEEILASERLLKNYLSCLLGTGKCTPDGTELKKNLPDALVTGCSKCSERQKMGAEKVIKHLIDHKHAEWKLLEDKYDPGGVYRKKYEEQEKKLRSGK